MEIEWIKCGEQVLAVIIPNEYEPENSEFITPSSYRQQVGFIVYPEEGMIQPHLHHELQRKLLGTSEVLLVKKGRCRVDFYLEDKTWALESYGEQDSLQAVLKGTEITALFDSAKGRVHGSAGCNSYSGNYQAGKSKLSIPMVASTEMYCLEPEGVMEQEQRYLRALQSAESYEVGDGKLRITAGSQVLVFKAK